MSSQKTIPTAKNAQRPFILAHISDIHLDPMPKARLRQLVGKRMIGHFNWHRSRKKIHLRNVLEKLIADLQRQDHHHTAITGDVVNIGLPEEFENALEWLERLGTSDQLSVVPGNHDAYVHEQNHQGFWRWHHFMSSTENAHTFLPTYFSQKDHQAFPFVRLFGKIALIGLSSAIPTAPFIAAGKLGYEQSQSLANALKKLKQNGYYRIVMLHHPPFVEKAQWMHGLRDAKTLMGILHKNGADLVLHGHTHKHQVRSLPSEFGDIPVIGVPSASQYKHAYKPSARYNLYSIEPAKRGWKMEMNSHGITDLSSPVKLLEQNSFFTSNETL